MISYDLISKVRRGEINLEKLLDVLSGKGYITEHCREDGCSLGATDLEAFRQEQLDSLLSFFFPDTLYDMLVDRAASAEGGDGSYSYGIFNKKNISRDQMLKILKKENARNNL